MIVLRNIFSALDDELTPNARRLLEAIGKTVGPLTAGAEGASADKQTVLECLASSEKGLPSPDAVTRFCEQINQAARTVAEGSGQQEASFVIEETETAFILKLNRKAIVRSAVMASTKADADKADPSQLEEPRGSVGIPHYQVMISHGWENGNVEKVIKEFISDLREKCRNLPHKFQGRFTVDIWFDKENMHGRLSTFEDQTDQACRNSYFALFFLSDKWYARETCQREAAFFQDLNSDQTCRFLRIQLTGSIEDGNPAYTNGPIYPTLWDPAYSNLLQVWEQPPSVKDAFVGRIRKEICDALSALTPVPPPSSPPPPKELSVREKMQAKACFYEHYDDAVRSEKVEDPHGDRKEDGDGKPLLPLLLEWANSQTAQNRVVALLGSFGAGKTTTVQLFARELAEQEKNSPDSRAMPVYLDLRRLNSNEQDRTLSLSEIIARCLDGEVSGQEVIELLHSERWVIIFDGLDEVGTRIGPERATALYRQLLEIIPAEIWNGDRKDGKANWAACQARILVTCRTHFFRDYFEQQSTLCANDRHDTGPRKAGDALVDTLYMAPFTPEQIRSLFCKNLGEKDGAAAFRTIGHVSSLDDLAKKPIMTRYIAELAPDLEQDQREGRRIDAARIYDHLFRRALERDNDKRPFIKPEDRETLLEALAVHLWQQKTPVLDVKQLNQWFDQYIEKTPWLKTISSQKDHGRDLLQTELRNASLLVREDGSAFRFVHTSFQEYFLARALYESVMENGGLLGPEMPPISREAIAFILDLVEGKAAWTRWQEEADRLAMAGNALSVRTFSWQLRLAAVQRGRPLSIPSAADFSDLDLSSIELISEGMPVLAFREVNFRGARFNGARFTKVRFERCCFDDVVLSQAHFVDCSFQNCFGDPAAAVDTRALGCDDRSGWLARTVPFVFKTCPPMVTAPASPQSYRVNFENLPFRCAAFSPDGQHVVTLSIDGRVCLWDVWTACLLRSYSCHREIVASVIFSPTGQQILTASYDGTARLWDVRSGAEIRCYQGHQERVHSAVFSPDGRQVLTASDDQTARLWNADSADEVMCFVGHQGPVRSAVFSPDGQQVLTASDDHTARLWDLNRGDQARVIFSGHQGPVSSAVFSPDGQQILTASSDHTIAFWDPENGNAIEQTDLGKRVKQALFSPDGQWFLIIEGFGRSGLWQTRTREKRADLLSWFGISGAFSPESRYVFIEKSYDTAQLWDVAAERGITTYRSYMVSIDSVVFLPQQNALLTLCSDDCLRHWDAASGELQERTDWRAFGTHGLQLSPTGKHVVGWLKDRLSVWDCRTGERISLFEGDDEPSFITFSGDGQQGIVGFDGGRICQWDLHSGQILHDHHTEETPIAATLSSDHHSLIALTKDGMLHRWNKDGEHQTLPLSVNEEIGHAVFSSNSCLLATWDEEGTVQLWNGESGALVPFPPPQGIVLRVALSADGRFLAMVLISGEVLEVQVWDRQTETSRILAGHEDMARSVVFSPDGSRVATTAHNGVLRLWDSESGALCWAAAALPDSWCVLNADLSVRKMGPNSWRYLYGMESQENDLPRVVCPTLC